MRVTTPGRLMMEQAIPEKYWDRFDVLDEKSLKALATDIAKNDPDLYADFISNVADVSRDVVYRRGREASVGLADLKLPKRLKEYRDLLRKRVDAIIVDGRLSPEARQKKVVDTLRGEIANIPKEVLKAFETTPNGLAEQTRSGARGNPNQLMQVLFGDVLVVDAKDRPVPIAGLHSYGEGVTPMEYWASASGSRKGSVSVQFSTAQGGYLGKQLSNLGHRVVVTGKDCGTTAGIPVKGNDPDNVGSILASPVNGHSAGELITEDMLDELGDKTIRVRSASTCSLSDGVCAHCVGVREGNTLPAVGSHVGVIGSRAMSEPITQAGLKVKHSGGVASSDDKQVSGFKEMDQFLQVPATFQGAATLASVDGKVTAVRPAPAGGSYVFVNSEEHYVPRGIEVTAKPGDAVYAGDVLSDGIPNPSELVQYKGIGEGRRYFIDKYREILNRNKASVHRRNLEIVARGFVNRVVIDKPEGYHGYVYGDVVPYDQFAADYTPRDGSKETPIGQANNQYLEKPYLHYTIGTRVTPHVVKDLKDEGVSTIIVNKDTPVFKPQLVRSRSLLSTDQDWMTRMGGENLKKNLLESARMGATSTPVGTSYFPAVADPSRLDIYKGGKEAPVPYSNFMEVDPSGIQ